MPATADIALIGLAVMGQNIILNMNDHGYVVCAFNRTTSKVDDFLANEAKGTKVIGAHSLAGNGRVAEEAAPRHDAGEGRQAGRRIHRSAHPAARARRHHHRWRQFLFRGHGAPLRGISARPKGILFVGSGVSGGEEGARHGPSLMPGGAPEAGRTSRPIFQSIAAQGRRRRALLRLGRPRAARAISSRWCTTASSTATCSSFARPTSFFPATRPEQRAAGRHVHRKWNKEELDSYLIETTSHIFKFKDRSRATAISSTRSSTPPGRKAPASGPCSPAWTTGAPL